MPLLELSPPLDAETNPTAEESTTNLDSFKDGLGAYIRRCWEAALYAKRPIEDEMLRSLRQRSGVYEATEKAYIDSAGGVPIYMLLTDEKVSSAIAWIKDAIFQPDQKPWSLKPTPVPDLNPQEEEAVTAVLAQEIMDRNFMMSVQDVNDRANDLYNAILREKGKQAEQCAKRMERKIEDQFEEGGFTNALDEFLDEMVTFPAGFVKGPIFRKKKSLVWANGKPVLEDKIVMDWEAISAFDAFPSPNSKTIDDGYFIERSHLTRRDLNELIGVDGFDEEAIREVLQAAEGSSLEDWCNSETQENERERLEDRGLKLWDPEARITALIFYGDVQGSMLIEWGMGEEDIPDPDMDYQVECWLIKDWVICARLNPDPLGRKPYFKASYRNKTGSFWGFGVPYLVRDIQEGCNYAARSLFNNMTIGSGPQVVVDTDRFDGGDSAEGLVPWKIWQVDSSRNSSAGAPIAFFQPEIKAKELMEVYESWEQKADNKTGIPKYTYGGVGGGQGALSTATGLSQMMANASKALKEVITHIDRGIVELAVDRQYTYNMLFDPDPSIKGDLRCVAMGSDALMAREQIQLRRNEALQLVLNPAVLNLIGIKGLSTFMREHLRGLKFSEDIVPPREEIERMAAMQQIEAQKQQALPQGEDAQGKPQNKQQEVTPAGQVPGGQEERTV